MTAWDEATMISSACSRGGPGCDQCESAMFGCGCMCHAPGQDPKPLSTEQPKKGGRK